MIDLTSRAKVTLSYFILSAIASSSSVSFFAIFIRSIETSGLILFTKTPSYSSKDMYPLFRRIYFATELDQFWIFVRDLSDIFGATLKYSLFSLFSGVIARSLE